MERPVEPPGTVFYLIPRNYQAVRIVAHPPNSNLTWPDPEQPSEPWLRIGLDQPHISAPEIARFGRLSHSDVILPPGLFSARRDQCHFSFNKYTGELLLRDLSEDFSTHLYELEVVRGRPGKAAESIECQLQKQPRQCVVLLTPDPYRDDDDPRGRQRKYGFEIRGALFWLIPPMADATVAQTVARFQFANGDSAEQTAEPTLERIVASALRIGSVIGSTANYYQFSLPGSRNVYNTRSQAQLGSDDDATTMETTKLGLLGSGGQGEVHLVVDNHDGSHLACKEIALSNAQVYYMSARTKDFRAKVEQEVKQVQRLRHANIVPYVHCQGFKTEVIELFIPFYIGSLHELARERRSTEDTSAVAPLAANMLSQILDALDFVHTRNPPIIHRNIKPANILYEYIAHGEGGVVENFLLADFGLTDVWNWSCSDTGTQVYDAPELKNGFGGKPTTKIDIYSLGVTVVDCFTDVIHFKDRFPNPGLWTRELQTLMTGYAPQYISMLETDPNQRLTAQQLRQLVPQDR